MQEKEELLQEYMPKIFRYAAGHTASLQDAEDLTQDIFVKILTAFSKKQIPQHLNAWIWRVAGNTLIDKYRRDAYRKVVFGIPETIQDCKVNTEDDLELASDINTLRRELAFLTKARREITILHYINEYTVGEIASMLGLPSGTVKWHLSGARTELMKGMDRMRTFGEKSYKPQKLTIGIYGNIGTAGEPLCYVTRALPQNILLAAYKKPLTMEELCEELGVSAPYIEDETERLVKSELLCKRGKKYMTDFPIALTEDVFAIAEIVIGEAERFCEILVKGVRERLERIKKIDFWKAACSDNQLMWIFVIQTATEFFRSLQENTFDDMAIPVRENGGRWYALGTSVDDQVAEQIIRKSGRREEEYNLTLSGPMMEWNDQYTFFMVDTRWSKARINHDDIISKKETWFHKVMKCASLPLKISTEDLPEPQKELMASALEANIYQKEGNGFIRVIPTFTKEQMADINEILNELRDNSNRVVQSVFEKVAAMAEKSIPEGVLKNSHFKNTYHTIMSSMIIPAALNQAVEKGYMKEPDDIERQWMSCYIINLP